MQSRGFFSLGARFNILVDSLIVFTNPYNSSSIPPGSSVMITESGIPMITEITSSGMITE